LQEELLSREELLAARVGGCDAPDLAGTVLRVIERTVGTEDDVDGAPEAATRPAHEGVGGTGDPVPRAGGCRVVDRVVDEVREEIIAAEAAEAGGRERAADDRRAERRGPAVRVAEDGVDVAGLLAARGQRPLAVRPGIVAARDDD